MCTARGRTEEQLLFRFCRALETQKVLFAAIFFFLLWTRLLWSFFEVLETPASMSISGELLAPGQASLHGCHKVRSTGARLAEAQGQWQLS